MPAFGLEPPLFAGAAIDPESSGAPNPTPLRPEPVVCAAPIEGAAGSTLASCAGTAALELFTAATDGGGATTFGPPSVAIDRVAADEATDAGGATTFAESDAAERVAPDTPTDAGGATTFGVSDAAPDRRVPFGSPEPFRSTGGGSTLLVRECAAEFDDAAPLTLGGAATTSVGPKILPIRLLMNDPPAGCAGGAGTTVAGEIPPFARRRISPDTSADGGGATTAGAGKVTFDARAPALSGAETGGATTVASAMRTGVLVTS